MSDEPLTTLTLARASELIHAGRLSPVDLVEAHLARIEALNPALNAFLTVMAAEARQEARHAADALARGEDWGALHGIPVGVKDLIDVAGVRTTAGSEFLRDHVAAEDAAVIQQLRAAGAIIIGKTHLHEYAIGATNVNPHYGPARNPWNPDLSPGGSSGGSAVAVAAGLCMAALGTDTGGSVRVPSALCGLTGLRPAAGQVSTQGVIPMSWTLDTVGPMARTARDAAILFDAMTDAIPAGTVRLLDRTISGLRLGVAADDFVWNETAIEIVSAVRAAADLLHDQGMSVADVSLPGMPDALAASGVISLGDAAAYHRDRLLDTPERFGADVRKRLEWGIARSAADYAQARHTARLWQRTLYELFRDHIDVLALPTTPVVSHALEGSEGLRAARELLRFTYPVSLSGLPALSLPCGFTEDGLPVGLQLVAREAGILLQVAHAYQQVTDWHTCRPSL
jgi:aspartyl-tRNA(Asn)/glutamyl-tRNA(Gln) amidotransferase subunit A